MGEATRRVRITAGSASAEATLDGSRTATAVWEALPISAPAQTWGDEIYFDIGTAIAPESPKAVVERGDLGYWPPGQAFCVFFGPTPVNVFGRVAGDPTVFKQVRSGTTVRIERAGGGGR